MFSIENRKKLQEATAGKGFKDGRKEDGRIKKKRKREREKGR